ncbi:aminotransferase class I/II-fold pyridoxal phosphate-dependent enzyme [Taibaiella lutea]|uniref:Aminotransferase class I/II-fold pyridoxal phosphate-dependent enzyme n=1 Tax=Taibaiella lutea TaxID=2608001 RepID=A0A5M6CVF9_9BACT|nr:aminotransferase class I/II-fold pyridoxal phosphate-dependent enzyme [Taibaiella lutea]KAA5537199.1 aminotransferase class I/II-fold pyridoxal phosphate-dependent enzyme [Taibaiella lutea]
MSKLSNLAESLVGSEIVKLGNEINNRIRNGEKIYNYTIGDFAPAIFPIPVQLKDAIIKAYNDGFTNYPAADGILPLREAVSAFIETKEHIKYDVSEIQIASGGRPLIYSLFATVVNPGDKVIYAVPSWNNNHYTNLNHGKACEIVVTPENNFMPTAADIAPHIEGAALLCLCTPQNPTGTTLGKKELEKICDMVLAENEKRGADEKKLYVLFDQMYFTLCYGDTKHYHPVALRPEMKAYTITVDGISKSFAATGVRVGWSLGPAPVMAKMKALLSHIGAWAPMAEQKATADFLVNTEAVDAYLADIKGKLETRLWKIYNSFEDLKAKGYNVDAIVPQAAIYLTAKIDLKGKKLGDKVLEAQADVTQFLLSEACVALVPFNCFGADKESPWYRISVGTCTLEDLDIVFKNLENALSRLK